MFAKRFNCAPYSTHQSSFRASPRFVPSKSVELIKRNISWFVVIFADQKKAKKQTPTKSITVNKITTDNRRSKLYGECMPCTHAAGAIEGVGGEREYNLNDSTITHCVTTIRFLVYAHAIHRSSAVMLS